MKYCAVQKTKTMVINRIKYKATNRYKNTDIEFRAKNDLYPFQSLRHVLVRLRKVQQLQYMS